MRQRLLLGIAILILVLAFSIGAAIGMKAIHKPGEIWLTQAAEYALAGDMEQAILAWQYLNEAAVRHD